MSETEQRLHFDVFQPSPTERIVRVIVPAEAVQGLLAAKIKSVQKTAVLPGFRKGKIPESVIRSRWLEVLMGEVRNQLIEANTPTIMDHENVDKKTVVGDPVIKRIKISEEKGLSYEIHLKSVSADSVVDFTEPAPKVTAVESEAPKNEGE